MVATRLASLANTLLMYKSGCVSFVLCNDPFICSAAIKCRFDFNGAKKYLGFGLDGVSSVIARVSVLFPFVVIVIGTRGGVNNGTELLVLTAIVESFC